MVNYLIGGIFLIVFFILFFVILVYYEKYRISKKIELFADYITVLEFHMKKSYDIIYKDRMLVYSLDATKVTDKEFNIISKDYAYLVLKLLGPSLTQEFIDLYGNEETLIFNIIEYFNTRVETDEIREKARQNLLTESKIFNDKETLTKNLMI